MIAHPPIPPLLLESAQSLADRAMRMHHRHMAKWQVLVLAAIGSVLTIVLALLRDAAVLAGISAVGTLVVITVTIVKWLRKTIKPGKTSWTVAALVAGSAIAAPVAVRTLPPWLLGAATSPAPQAGFPTPTTADATLAQYCEEAVAFLGHAQRFSGVSWQGATKKSDFDPIVGSLRSALATAPHEMRAPLTVLASSYEAAQADWSDDNMVANLGLAVGTILSPSARAASDVVDTFENEHCF